jgi:nucleoside-diphosphate-sugar epimerase
MHNSALINLNIAQGMVLSGVKNVFFTSSACVYPQQIQTDPESCMLSEPQAYPADPDSEYGWEKLFSERLYLSFAKNYSLRVRIARLHNVFGPYCSWNDQRAKAPAALCRKVAVSEGTVKVYGPGQQTRSFLYIDQCIQGIHRMIESDCDVPLNLGSDRIISINDLVQLIAKIGNKTVEIKNVPGPIGVMGRTSDNSLIQQYLDWAPDDQLEHGLTELYSWIVSMINNKENK